MARPKPPLVRALVKARHDAGLTQRTLADDMQIQPALLARWETGQHAPTLTSLQRWAYSLGYDLTLTRRDGR